MSGLAQFLSRYDDIEVVAESWHPEAVLTLLFDAPADVAVLDALLLPPDRDYMERLSSASMGVVVVTPSCGKSSELGVPLARGFRTFAQLALCEAPGSLVEAIRCVARGEPRIGAARRCALHSSAELSGLTNSELRVLGLIVRGLSNKFISDTLDVSVRTVENHRYRLMQKLQARNIVELTVYAARVGLVDL